MIFKGRLILLIGDGQAAAQGAVVLFCNGGHSGGLACGGIRVGIGQAVAVNILGGKQQIASPTVGTFTNKKSP